MPYCGKCGNKLPEDAMFCNRCGNRIEKAYDLQENSSASADFRANNIDRTNNVSSNFKLPKKKKKNGKIVVIISAISLLLVAVIISGIIILPSWLSSGPPKIKKLDKKSAVFDLDFEGFKKKFNDAIEPAFNVSDGTIPSGGIKMEEYKNEFNKEDNWYTWKEDDTINHKWTYNYDDEFWYDIIVTVDKESNKIKKISSSSYAADVMTKMILTSLLVYGEDAIEDNFESIYNLTLFLRNEVESENYILDIDNLIIFSYRSESESSFPTYYYIAGTEDMLKDNSDTVINLTQEDLSHLDKALSAKYGIEYEWKTP